MRIVLDTNVLVSALLRPAGVSARLFDEQIFKVGSPIRILVDERVLAEYRDVLSRKKFGIDAELIDDVLEGIEAISISIDDPPPFTATTTPEQDKAFVEVALAGDAAVLVTGNKKHAFKDAGVDLMSPGELLRVLEADDDDAPP